MSTKNEQLKETGTRLLSPPPSVGNLLPLLDASEIAKCDGYLVGRRIEVYWPAYQMYFAGAVEYFSAFTKMHKILFTDGDVETLNMKTVIWKFDKDGEESHKGGVSDGENHELKADKVTGQKTSSAPDKEENIVRPVDAALNDDGSTIDSDTKETKLSSGNFESVSDKQDAMKIKKAQGKTPLDLASEIVKCDGDLVGCRIKVYWPAYQMYFAGVVEYFNASTKKHKILFTDGDVEMLNMKTVIWKFDKDGEESHKASEIAKSDEDLVGRRIKVYWPAYDMYFAGVVESFSLDIKKHKILYIDGDVEMLNMKTVIWKFDKDVELSDKASEIAKCSEDLVGRRIKVYWPAYDMYFAGVVETFSPDFKKHKILYTDGDVEMLNMKTAIWKFDKDVELSDKGGVSDGENLEASSEIEMARRDRHLHYKDCPLAREWRDFALKYEGKNHVQGEALMAAVAVAAKLGEENARLKEENRELANNLRSTSLTVTYRNEQKREV